MVISKGVFVNTRSVNIDANPLLNTCMGLTYLYFRSWASSSQFGACWSDDPSWMQCWKYCWYFGIMIFLEYILAWYSHSKLNLSWHTTALTIILQYYRHNKWIKDVSQRRFEFRMWRECNTTMTIQPENTYVYEVMDNLMKWRIDIIVIIIRRL